MERKISVVIPVHNAEYNLKECMDSIYKTNGYKNFEVIVVNDCSSDKSVEIAQQYPCKIINLLEQRGPAFARDKGAFFAKGEIVAFLDSDCITPKDWLHKINARLTSDIIGIGGKYKLPPNIHPIFYIFLTYWDPKNIFYTKPRDLISLSGGNCAFWKSSLMKIRKKKELVYTNKMVGGEDTILCRELRQFGRLIYDPTLFVVHNKRCRLLNIFKETIDVGYSGAIAARVCGNLLIREPHRLYKSIIYTLSISILFLIALLPIIRVWPFYFATALVYLATQLPIIYIAQKHLSNRIYALFFPIVIFTTDILHFIGHIKRILVVMQKFIKSSIWHLKFIANIVNPFALSRLFFFVTKKCNADCYFCFNKKNNYIHQEGNDLSPEEIKGITHRIGFLPWLTITGGEPFLREDLCEILKLFYINCDTRFISIVTNGMLSSRIKETAETLLIDCEHLRLTIIVALDDIGEKHNLIKGVDDCYQKALETMRELNELKVRFPRLTLDISTILIKENASHIEEIVCRFRNNFTYDRHYVGLLRQPACTSIDPGLISIHHYFGLVEMSNRTLANEPCSIGGRFNRALFEYCCEKSLKEFRQKRSIGICSAAQKFFVLNNDGNVFACELLPAELGNLREEGYDLNKIRSSSKSRKIRSTIRNTQCYCQWPCAITTNALYTLSTYPKIVKKMILKKT